MIQEHYQTLFDYSFHTAQRLLDQAALMEDEGYHAHPGYGHGSLHDLFYHLMVNLRGWRIALETGQQPASPNPVDFPTLLSIRMAFDQERESWQRLIATLHDEQINGPVVLMTARGDRSDLIYWRVLQHLLFHSMQHHTEIAHLLTDHGHSPGDIDFIFYDG